MTAYATRAELVAYVPATLTVPAEPEATRLLTHASEILDDLLITAVYKVDSGGLPTETAVVDALRQATCAQAQWWLETGDESGAQAQYQSVSIGSVSLTRGYSAGASGTGAAQTVGPRAAQILHLAGLLPAQPTVL